MKKSFYEAEINFEQFRNEFPHQTREFFMVDAKAILQPDRDYYNSLFHKEGEDCYDKIRMASAAIFQPSNVEGEIRS